MCILHFLACDSFSWAGPSSCVLSLFYSSVFSNIWTGFRKESSQQSILCLWWLSSSYSLPCTSAGGILLHLSSTCLPIQVLVMLLLSHATAVPFPIRVGKLALGLYCAVGFGARGSASPHFIRTYVSCQFLRCSLCCWPFVAVILLRRMALADSVLTTNVFAPGFSTAMLCAWNAPVASAFWAFFFFFFSLATNAPHLF